MTDDEKKEEVIRLIEGAGPEAKKLEAMGQQVVESARLTQDLAGPLAQLFRVIPTSDLSSEGWDIQLDNWNAWHAGVRKMQHVMPAVSGMTMASVNSTFTTASMYFSLDQPMILAGAGEAFMAVSGAIERHNLADRAITSMRRLSLDRRGGNLRPALDLLAEAKGAMERPVVGDGGSVSVLISLRECVDATITELVRRRPEQEPAKNWKEKVVSIGRKCGKPSLPATHFDKIGNCAGSA
jgi:hypothetical protein